MKLPISPAAALFSVKNFAAAMLALYIALGIGMENPAWAVITTYVVAQPLSGAVLSKSVFRVTGTFAGACMSVLLVPPLVQAPACLSLAIALWLGACVFLSSIDRTARSYMFVLAGYSTCIIVFPSVGTPTAIFDVAVSRVQEITLGIACSALIHATVFPSSSNKLLLKRLDASLRDAARWSRDALSVDKPPGIDAERRRLAVDINELHDLLIHVSFEGANDRRRMRAIQSLLEQFLLLLPLCVAVDDRWTELVRLGVPLDPGIVALLDDVRAWFSAPAGALAQARLLATELRERCARLEPVVEPEMAWKDALLLSLLARLSRLITVHLDCMELRDAVAGAGSDSAPRPGSAPPRRPARRVLHRDYRGALGAALATSLTILAACALWIASGWEVGGNAVMLVGVYFAIYSGFANPSQLLKNKFVGVACRLALGAVYVCAVLPGIDGFPMLALALSPVLFVCGALLTVPRYSPMAFNLIIGILSPSVIATRFVPDFAAYLNGGIASLTGIYFALVMANLTQFMWVDGMVQRTLRAGWRDIARQKYGAEAAEIGAWRSRMAHRVALLTPRMARDGSPQKPTYDALRDMMTGLSMAQLNLLRPALSDAQSAQLASIINEVGEHYRLLGLRERADLRPALLGRIQNAMRVLAGADSVELRRNGTLALVSLRRNLFPQEATPAEVV